MGHFDHVGNLHQDFNFKKNSEMFRTRASSFESSLGYLESCNNLDFGQLYFSGTNMCQLAHVLGELKVVYKANKRHEWSNYSSFPK